MINLAFSTNAGSPDALMAAAAQAAQLGFEGIEWMPTPAIVDGPRIKPVVDVPVICLGSSARWRGEPAADAQAADGVKRDLDLAAALGARRVRVVDGPPPAGVGLRQAGVAFGDWLSPLGDQARQRGLVLVVANVQAHRTARALWDIVDRLQHPAIACCYEPLASLLAGERPAVTIPTLNSRIRHVRLSGATLNAGNQLVAASLEHSMVPVPQVINRLKGIGYDGWLSLGGDPATLAGEVRWLKTLIAPPPAKPAAAEKPAVPAKKPAAV